MLDLLNISQKVVVTLTLLPSLGHTTWNQLGRWWRKLLGNVNEQAPPSSRKKYVKPQTDFCLNMVLLMVNLASVAFIGSVLIVTFCMCALYCSLHYK